MWRWMVPTKNAPASIQPSEKKQPKYKHPIIWREFAHIQSGHLSQLHLLFKLKNQHTCCTNMCNLQTCQGWFMGKTNGSFIQNTKTIGFGWKTVNVESFQIILPAPVPSCHRPKQRCSTSSRKRSIPTARGSTSFCEPVRDGPAIGWHQFGGRKRLGDFFSLRNGKSKINNNRDDGLKGNWPECESWNGDLMLVWNVSYWPNICLHLDHL